jgi:multiple sugar transport system substrate-binding protein
MSRGEKGVTMPYLDDELSRRDFLRLAALAGAAVALPGCGGNGGEAGGTAGVPTDVSGELKIIQWSHFVPAYDEWFDNTYVPQWEKKTGVKVTVDHVDFSELPTRASAEVAAQSGHDLFWSLSSPARFEDQVIDHQDIVDEVKRQVGGDMIPVCDRSTFNPKTNKRVGFADNWVPDPVHWRTDYWAEAGFPDGPNTWDDVKAAGPKLKQAGHPLGIGISQDIDANMALIALGMCFGSYIQDEDHNVTINSPETVDAVTFMAEVYKGGMTPEVFSWDASSNNRFFLAGKGSLVLNAISVVRTAETDDPELAENTAIAPVPEGPNGREGLEHVLGVYIIWKFAKNQEAAKRFLVDLAVDYKEAFVNSKFYNFPSFPATVPDLKQLIATDDAAKPPDKYAILGDFQDFSFNVGYPGYTNPAVDEVFSTFLIPQMYAEVARGGDPQDVVDSAEQQINAVYDKWRAQGKI